MKKHSYILFILFIIFVFLNFLIEKSNNYISGSNCLALDTKIKTTELKKRISDIQVGDIVLSDNNKPAKVIQTTKVEVTNHKLLRIILDDATVLEVSPRHPTADGRKFSDLKVNDNLDGRKVVKISETTYNYPYTYDILPDSETGNYYANGVLIGSTLKKELAKN